MDQAALIQILKTSDSSPAGVFQKGKACHRLAQVGTKEAVPALAALLTDQQLAALRPLRAGGDSGSFGG